MKKFMYEDLSITVLPKDWNYDVPDWGDTCLRVCFKGTMLCTEGTAGTEGFWWVGSSSDLGSTFANRLAQLQGEGATLEELRAALKGAAADDESDD